MSVYHVFGVDNHEALKQVNSEAAATNYLLKYGMSESDILTLKDKLR
jgi:hypothetical protein